MRVLAIVLPAVRRTLGVIPPRALAVPVRFATTSSAAPPRLPPADPSTLALLTSYSKWQLLPTTGRLAKTFEFRDAATAGRFMAQARDALARLCASECPLTPQQTDASAPALATGAGAAAAAAAASSSSSAPAGKGTGASGPHRVDFVVALRGVSDSESGRAGGITQRELDVALAVDDVAAELQLGGRWN